VSDDRAWRLEVKLSVAAGAAARRRGGEQAGAVARELRKVAADDVVIDEDSPFVVVRAYKNEQIEQARQALDGILAAMSIDARVTVAHRERRDGEWAVTAGPSRAPRYRGRQRSGRDLPVLSRRARRIALGLMLVAGVGGATFYALAPGVASYQASYFLVLPILVAALVWVHRRLPIRSQWAVAITLSAAGPVGYLVYGGSEWWYWGQTAVLPLILLLVRRSASRTRRDGPREPWYGGPLEGPWGPP
jgi:hypothetical protein